MKPRPPVAQQAAGRHAPAREAPAPSRASLPAARPSRRPPGAGGAPGRAPKSPRCACATRRRTARPRPAWPTRCDPAGDAQRAGPGAGRGVAGDAAAPAGADRHLGVRAIEAGRDEVRAQARPALRQAVLEGKGPRIQVPGLSQRRRDRPDQEEFDAGARQARPAVRVRRTDGPPLRCDGELRRHPAAEGALVPAAKIRKPLVRGWERRRCV